MSKLTFKDQLSIVIFLPIIVFLLLCVCYSWLNTDVSNEQGLKNLKKIHNLYNADSNYVVVNDVNGLHEGDHIESGFGDLFDPNSLGEKK